MPGQMGGKKITVQNLEIVKVDVENNLLLVKGAVPGPKKSMVSQEEMLEKAKENLGKYTKYGLVFPYRFFSLILIHMPALEIMEDFTKKEQLRLVVLSSASEAFSVLGKAYGIHTNGQNIGILLNTSIAEAELTAELKRLCSAISQRMQQTLSIDPFFSIVLCEQASPSYQKSWQLARRNLLFTSPETEDFMIIGHQEDLTSSLDPNLSIQLSRALIDLSLIHI